MKNKRILIVRNDKLGDFMLAWPAFALIKHYCPQATVAALVPQYTAEIAHLCPWIDEILLDEGETPLLLTKKLSERHFDAVLTLFSTSRIAISTYLARIPYRLAPATKIAQLLYNHRLTQRRSRSEKPEYAYNLDLAYQLLADFNVNPLPKISTTQQLDYLPEKISRPLLKAVGKLTRTTFAKNQHIEQDGQWIFIHPGSGGSANNLTTEQYAELANDIVSKEPVTFIISAGPGEQAAAESVANNIDKGLHRAITISPQGVTSLVEILQFADLFISGSTGPLHIAGAMNLATAAFYPRHRSATPLRWQTLNAPEKRLIFTPPESAEASDVRSIDIPSAAKQISKFLSDL